MRSNRTFSPDDFQLLSRFEAAQSTLLQKTYEERLEKPLGYWALPNDRRLPFVLLGHKLRELLHTPFDELLATPGIGKKKIESLVMLLERAIEDDTFGLRNRPKNKTATNDGTNGSTNGNKRLDSSSVSETQWSQWCNRIGGHGLGYERLGRLVPSLQSVPSVIWNTPLDFYLEKSLADIRSLKTHGKKRVDAVVQLFSQLNEVLSKIEDGGALALRLVPRLIARVDDWLSLAVEDSNMLSEQEIESCLAMPLLNQIEIDAGHMVRDLAQGRLGIGGPSESIRTVSRKHGVTRARIYQLLDDCATILQTRWPNGKSQLQRLIEKLDGDGLYESRDRLEAICDFFYPVKTSVREFDTAAMVG